MAPYTPLTPINFYRMRLVITGTLALIILIIICAIGKHDTDKAQSISTPASPKKAAEHPYFIPFYDFGGQKNFIFPQTVEKVFHLSLPRK